MEAQILLRDSEIFPTDEVLRNTLVDSVHEVLESFIHTITSDEYGLIPEWKFYNDGKAWLCKVVYKKKTVFWLSIWEGYFQIGFFFTEKHLEAIAVLDIDEKIKEDFCLMKPVGKLLPMIFKIVRNEQIKDLLIVVRFKKNLK